MKFIITVESDTKLSVETWKRIRSRIDFLLEREIDAPHLHTHLDVKEDIKRPRPEAPRTVEDMI